MTSSALSRRLSSSGFVRRSVIGGLTATTAPARPFLQPSQASAFRTFSTQPVVEEELVSDDSSVAGTSRAPPKTMEPVAATGEWQGCKRSFMAPLTIPTHGKGILVDPLFNKGKGAHSPQELRATCLLMHFSTFPSS